MRGQNNSPYSLEFQAEDDSWDVRESSPETTPRARYSPRSPRIGALSLDLDDHGAGSHHLRSDRNRPMAPPISIPGTSEEATVPPLPATKTRLKSPRLLLKERALGDLYSDMFQCPVSKLTDEYKRSVMRRIRNAMHCGAMRCVVGHLVNTVHYALMPPNKDSFRVTDLQPSHLETDEGLYLLHGAVKELATWLLGKGVEWDIYQFSVFNSITGCYVPSQRAEFLATWSHARDAPVHKSCDRNGQLALEWETNHVIKTADAQELYSKWKRSILNAMAIGSTRTIIVKLGEGSDYEEIHDTAKFRPAFEGQVVPLGARQFPSHRLLPKIFPAAWKLDIRHKKMVQWLIAHKLSWYLLFEVDSHAGSPVLSPFAYLCAVYINTTGGEDR